MFPNNRIKVHKRDCVGQTHAHSNNLTKLMAGFVRLIVTKVNKRRLRLIYGSVLLHDTGLNVNTECCYRRANRLLPHA